MTTPDLLELSEQILSGRRTIDDHHPLQIGGATVLQGITERVSFVESFQLNPMPSLAVSRRHVIDVPRATHAP